MKTTLFDWVASLTLATLLVGIWGGSQTGTSFSLAPVAAILNAQINPHDVTNEPVADVAKRAKDRVIDGTKEAIATAANQQTDHRLAGCQPGSQEPGNEIPLATAKAVQQMTIGTLIEIQGHLGQPHCNEQTRWVYAIAGGGVLIANETKEGVQINVRNSTE